MNLEKFRKLNKKLIRSVNAGLNITISEYKLLDGDRIFAYNYRVQDGMEFGGVFNSYEDALANAKMTNKIMNGIEAGDPSYTTRKREYLREYVGD